MHASGAALLDIEDVVEAVDAVEADTVDSSEPSGAVVVVERAVEEGRFLQ